MHVLAEEHSLRDVAEQLGRSYRSVRKKATALGTVPVRRYLPADSAREKERRRKIGDSRRVYATEEERKAAAAQRQRARLLSLRHEILDLLGGSCVGCGIVELAVLEIDHVKDDGKHHRRSVNRGIPYYRDLLVLAREEPDALQVLCANCHRRKTCQDKGWDSRYS